MKVRIIIICTVLLLSLGALMFLTGGQNSGTVVIADVNEILENPAKFMNQEIRVRGNIKPGALRYAGDKADFSLVYKGKELKVHFDGSTQLPDTFADGAPARADGRLTPDLKLVSNKVEAKCASKYEAKHAEGKDGQSGKHPAGVKITPYTGGNQGKTGTY